MKLQCRKHALPRLALCALGFALFSACGDSNTDFQALKKSAPTSLAAKPTEGRIEAPREDAFAKVKESSTFTTFAISGGQTRSDSLLDPTFIEVSDQSELTFAFDGSLPPLNLDLTLTRLSDGSVTMPIFDQNLAFARGKIALGPLLRCGESYRFSLRADYFGGGSEERKVIAYAPPRGVIGVALIDWDSDGVANHISLTADARIDFGHKTGGAMPLPALSRLRAFDTGDFDRDGRTDLALLGIDESGRSSVVILLNKRNGLVPEQYSDIGLAFPTCIRTLDLHNDGSPDLVVAGLDGGVVVLANPVHSNLFSRRDARMLNIETPVLAGAAPIGASSLVATDQDDDGLVDLLVCGGEMPALLVGTRFEASGLVGRADLAPEAAREAMHALGRARLGAPLFAQRAILDAERADKERFRELSSARLVEVFTFSNARFALAALNPEESALSILYPEGSRQKYDSWSIGMLGMLNQVVIDSLENVLLLACENGVYELAWEMPDAKPRLTFDSRVFYEKPSLVAVLPAGMRAKAMVDINGDGALDIVGLFDDDQGNALVGIWLNQIASGAGMVLAISLSAAGFDDVTPINLDADGFIDLLLTSRRDGLSRILRGNGSEALVEDDQNFIAKIPSDILGTPIVADFNDDTFPDIFWPTARGHISFGAPNALTPPLELPRMFNESGRTLRFKGLVKVAKRDGFPSLMAVLRDGKEERLAELVNYFFRAQLSADGFNVNLLGPAVKEIAAVAEDHFTYDESAPVVMRRVEARWELAVWRVGNRAFETIEDFGERNQPPRSLHFIDIDQDGDGDLAYLFDLYDDFFTLMINRGDGQFSMDTLTSYSLAEAKAGSHLEEARLLDLNGDGKPDLLAHSWSGDAMHSAPKR